MQFKRPSLKRLAFLLLVITPLVAWMFVKPIRVVAPQLMNVSCLSTTICVDDVAKYPEAERLYAEAAHFVAATVGPVERTPKVIFCASMVCAQSFGLGARSAVTIGSFGTVIGPRAWQAHYVRHEMIHHLQAERIGIIPLLFKPSWFVEGMAYTLSQDPRVPLAEPFEDYRKQFRAWYASINHQQLWGQARKL